MKRLIPVIVLAMVLASGSAWAADATANLDVMSAYVWRGITINDSPVLQPMLDVSKNGFGANVWANYDLDSYYNDSPDDYEFSEVDLTLYYGFSVQKLEITVGIIDYLFPAGGNDTVEVYTNMSYPLIGGLSAAFDFYYDVDQVNSYYTDLGLTYALSEALNVGAKLAYTDSLDSNVLADADLANGIYGHDVEFYGGLTVSYAF